MKQFMKKKNNQKLSNNYIFIFIPKKDSQYKL